VFYLENLSVGGHKDYRTVGSLMNTKLEAMCQEVFNIHGCMKDIKTTTETSVAIASVASRIKSSWQPNTSTK
jgi:hypothetical protein